jgi:phosphatidylserine/phosphatidylglycerophosphate/cardiolipin synthase-like enzyme
MIKEASHTIRIIQPYVQNIDELEDVLVEAMVSRGVKVEIVSARHRDQPVYKNFLNSELFQRLKSKGAVIYEEPFKYLHMKVIEVDDGAVMTLGSFNQDHWSFYCNNEANLYLRNANGNAFKAHREFMRVFNSLKRESRLVDFDETYTASGYIEITFWKLVLGFSHWIANNRKQ